MLHFRLNLEKLGISPIPKVFALYPRKRFLRKNEKKSS